MNYFDNNKNYDFEINGIYYKKIDSGVAVTFRKQSFGFKEADYFGNVVIPSSVIWSGIRYPVTSIGCRAFDGCKELLSVSIPDSVTIIDDSAFYGCKRLKNISIPNSVKFINKKAFGYCVSLESITIPDSVTLIGDYAFEFCTVLDNVSISNSVNTIGDHAFELCNNLSRITIPDSVTYIGNYAFSFCKCLRSVTIGAGVSSIGASVFSFCESLVRIIVDKENPTFDSRSECNAIIHSATNLLLAGCAKTVIPDSIVTIGASAFRGHKYLTSISVPKSICSIENNAFIDCNISQIHITDLEAWCKIAISLEESSNHSFRCPFQHYKLFLNGEQITNLIIPHSVSSIGNFAFSGCCISSIALHNSLYSIGDYSFYNCNIPKIIIPGSVKRIGKYAFAPSPSVIILSNTLNYIGENAFGDYKGYKILLTGQGKYMAGNSPTQNRSYGNLIPIKHLGLRGPFSYASEISIDYGITSIEDIIIESDDIFCFSKTPPICNNKSFENYMAKLHVPASSVAAYFTAPYWCEFKDLIGDAIKLTGLYFKLKYIEAIVGEEVNIDLQILPANAMPNSTTWISTNSQVVAIAKDFRNNLTRKIKAVSSGECDIIAFCLDQIASCHIVVLETKILFEQTTVLIKPNQIISLRVKSTSNEIPDLKVFSSDVNIAAARVVYGVVQVVGIREGCARITASPANGLSKSTTCIVTVRP